MNLYLACSGMMFQTYGDHLYERFCNPKPRFCELRSFVELEYFGGHTLPIFGRPFFLDSGAFTAYSQNREITPQQYGNFLSRYADQLDIYANLDAIPTGKSLADRADAAERTLNNQTDLESMGLKPIPVFHMGEPFEYLEYYLDNYEYICLGGLVDSGDYIPFFEKVWGEFLTDGAGRPTHKVHAFGMTSVKYMTMYPWYSVDSSTWLTHTKLGIISFPRKLANGDWDWNLGPTLVGISDRSSMRADEGTHYDNMTEIQREEIRNYLAMYGLAPEHMRDHPADRFICNMEYWINIQNHANFAKTFQRQQFELL